MNIISIPTKISNRKKEKLAKKTFSLFSKEAKRRMSGEDIVDALSIIFSETERFLRTSKKVKPNKTLIKVITLNNVLEHLKYLKAIK